MWHANIKTGHQTSFLSPSQWVFYFIAFALGNQLKHLNNRKLAAQWGKIEIISQTNTCDKIVSSWNSIAQMNQFTEGEWEQASSTWIVRKKGTI